MSPSLISHAIFQDNAPVLRDPFHMPAQRPGTPERGKMMAKELDLEPKLPIEYHHHHPRLSHGTGKAHPSFQPPRPLLRGRLGFQVASLILMFKLQGSMRQPIFFMPVDFDRA